MTALIEGSTAPTFSALDEQGNVRTLESYRGNWLLLYFYPKDDTPAAPPKHVLFEICSLN